MSGIEAVEWAVHAKDVAVVLTELLLPGTFSPGSDDPGKDVSTLKTWQASLRDWCEGSGSASFMAGGNKLILIPLQLVL
ncbi:MAG: hypothetical protein DA408_01020 [Bacteroidetes bacterium]|nr:MAG: hypothetical protein C7N36_02155 [Bacteroidota bacterium]PTM14903.1 MAG: hypothetical protein DA408_01020 [Bacteroidota bacterium]